MRLIIAILKMLFPDSIFSKTFQWNSTLEFRFLGTISTNDGKKNFFPKFCLNFGLKKSHKHRKIGQNGFFFPIFFS